MEHYLCLVVKPWAYFVPDPDFTKIKEKVTNWSNAAAINTAPPPADTGVIKVAFECGGLSTPQDYSISHSVNMINLLAYPGLLANSSAKQRDAIWAKTTLSDFVKRVLAVGGQVYVSVPVTLVPDRGTE